MHLKRYLRSPKRMAIIGKTRQKSLGNALAAAVRLDGYVHDLQAIARKLTARKANDGAAVVGNPPHAPRLRQLVLKEARRPYLVYAALETAALELGNLLDVVDGHGTQLRVDARKLLDHTRGGHEAIAAHAQALTLRLLRV